MKPQFVLSIFLVYSLTSCSPHHSPSSGEAITIPTSDPRAIRIERLRSAISSIGESLSAVETCSTKASLDDCHKEVSNLDNLTEKVLN